MRRAWRYARIAVLAGLLLTVSVAWVSAATVDVWFESVQRHGVSHETYPCWGLIVLEKPTASFVYREAIDGPDTFTVGWSRLLGAPRWSDARTPPPASMPMDTYSGIVEDGRGWPFICLKSEMDAQMKTMAYNSSAGGTRLGRVGWTYGAVRNGIRAQPAQGSERMPRLIPLRPVVSGFLLNVLVYAGAIWLVLWIFTTLRRRGRRRRGRCAECGYRLRGSARCPECGVG